VYHPDNVLDPLFEINPHKQIFTRFCKTILGVHSKAVNRAVRAELWVYPLFIHTILKTVKYWLHLMQLPQDSRAYNAHIDNKESSNIWCTNLKGILHRLGSKHTWENQGTLSASGLLTALKNKLNDNYAILCQR
jgi:hypothetical protein